MARVPFVFPPLAPKPARTSRPRHMMHTATRRVATIAPVSCARAGRPFNVLAGFDNRGDGQVNTHRRPFGVSRNSGRGPGFVATDLRVTKPLPLAWRQGTRVELTAEAFNLFDRTNFQAVNNTVGSLTAVA